MSSLLSSRAFISDQNECNCMIWDSRVRIMKIYQPGASYHHVLQWMFVFVSIFMVPTLSNQKITSPILLDLFLMAFFSSLLFSSEETRKEADHDQITVAVAVHHNQHKDGDRQGGFSRFLLRINEMRDHCQDCILSPVSPNNTISSW